MTLNDFAYKSVTRQFWEKRLQLLDVNATHGLRKQEIAFAHYLVIWKIRQIVFNVKGF